MFCKNCGQSVNAGADVCLNCGAKVGMGNTYCANCGAQHDPNADVCLKCGAAIRKASSNNEDSDIVWAVKTCFKKYATFSGRASRKEFWYFILVTTVVDWVLTALGAFSGGLGLPLYGIWELACFIPTIAVASRRLHDVGKSGWWWALIFACGIGVIYPIILACQNGWKGANQYGEEPAR